MRTTGICHDLAFDTLDRQRQILGEDHLALGSASQLATCLRELGQVQAARDLDQGTLDHRRALGDDHVVQFRRRQPQRPPPQDTRIHETIRKPRRAPCAHRLNPPPLATVEN